MLEWFSAHPVVTIFLILLITIRLWFLPVVLIVGLIVGTSLSILATIALALIGLWKWIDCLIRRLQNYIRRLSRFGWR